MLEFDQAEDGYAKIEAISSEFAALEPLITEKAGALEGHRINFVMEFNAVNGWYALTLCRLGARIKWASNDRGVAHRRGCSEEELETLDDI